MLYKGASKRTNGLVYAHALLMATMFLGIGGEPQSSSYLPPTGGIRPIPGGDTGHDDWAGDPANYEFSYEVQDTVTGLDFGHHETRKDNEATGTYHVLLPDGRTQIVEYIADDAGYRPIIRYEGTASYPAPGPVIGGGGGGGGGGAANEGYRYK